MIISNNTPVYLEIVNDYKRYIELGIYKSNDKLPSVRTLALELGVNPNTVQRAYKVLEDEGYIKSSPKRGIYVSLINNTINEDDNFRLIIQNYKNNNVDKEKLLKVIMEVYND